MLIIWFLNLIHPHNHVGNTMGLSPLEISLILAGITYLVSSLAPEGLWIPVITFCFWPLVLAFCVPAILAMGAAAAGGIAFLAGKTIWFGILQVFAPRREGLHRAT